MPDIRIDNREILALAAALTEVPAGAGKFVRKAVEVTARNVKDEWRNRLKGSPTVPQGPYSVSYDMRGGEALRGDTISAEIGPVLGSHQASIVGILEVGDAAHVPARGFGLAALKDNEQDFETGLTRALADAFDEVGL